MKITRIPGITVQIEDSHGFQTSTKVLDNNFYPWGIVRIDHADRVMRIIPTRADPPEHDPVELFPFDVQAPKARYHRLVDYLAEVEALDLEVVSLEVSSETPIEIPEGVKLRINQSTTAEAETLTIVTTYGDKRRLIHWGPVTLYPLRTPSKFPFNVRMTSDNRNVYISPSKAGYPVCLEVHDEVIHYGCSTITDALTLACAVVEDGWEKALKRSFSEVRIGFVDYIRG